MRFRNSALAFFFFFSKEIKNQVHVRFFILILKAEPPPSFFSPSTQNAVESEKLHKEPRVANKSFSCGEPTNSTPHWYDSRVWGGGRGLLWLFVTHIWSTGWDSSS